MTTQKVAVVVVHGIGNQNNDFYHIIRDNLKKHFATLLPDSVENPESELVIEPAWWAPLLKEQDEEFAARIQKGGAVGFSSLRQFILSSAADAIAYQPIQENRVLYDELHKLVATSINKLAEKAGEKAPLCVIAHSLGTIVMSNYIWDLQFDDPEIRPLITAHVADSMRDTPLERGETLAHFYTLGSPLALWSLRWREFDYGKPIAFPSPQLHDHYPNLEAEWINFYDKDDVVAYPLRGLNQEYETRVKEDREVNVGDWIQFWNPLSHIGYWGAPLVYEPIAEALAKTWKHINFRTSSTRESR